ncbi:MAG: DoxX family protein [Sphingomonas bacterium]|nr:DoxX family protein [Sphingomonas bacterium]
MTRILATYDRVTIALAGRVGEGIALLFLRVVFAGIFWRSGRTKVEEGSWITISDNARFLFSEEYAGVPLPPEFAAVAATSAEHLFPILLVIGLATRFSALALLLMTLVIQIFVYPDAWWSVHSLWVAMALVLIARGGGLFSVDRWLARGRRQ